jgi:uncharacterized membrane protein
VGASLLIVADLHPLLVHFPVALLTFGAFADLAASVRKNPAAEVVGWWAQLAGTAGILLSAATGLLAKGRLSEPAVLDLVATHEQLAFVTAAAFAGLFFWRVGSRGRTPSRLYLACLAGALLLVWGTAWFGGELVYRYGIGVAR